MYMQDALQVRDGEREQMEGRPERKVKQGRKVTTEREQRVAKRGRRGEEDWERLRTFDWSKEMTGDR